MENTTLINSTLLLTECGIKKSEYSPPYLTLLPPSSVEGKSAGTTEIAHIGGNS